MPNSIGKNILVTGGAGYIGSHTVGLLVEQGYNVTIIDDLSSGFKDSLPKEVTLIQGNILDESFLDSAFQSSKFDSLIHFAAKTVVPESCENPQKYYSNNLVGSLNVFSNCVKHGVTKVIFSSTAAVYGNANEVVSEESPCDPINPYGQTKLLSEKILQDFFQAYKLNYVVLRYFNVAGAHPNNTNGQRTKNATHLIKVAAEAASNKRKGIQVYGNNFSTPDGTCVRDYIHVMDLAQAHIEALKFLDANRGNNTFNCGYGKGSSVLEVIETMKRVSQSDFEVTMAPPRAGDPASLTANNSKILSHLEWTPQYQDLSLICDTAFKWESSQPD